MYIYMLSKDDFGIVAYGQGYFSSGIPPIPWPEPVIFLVP